MACPVISFLSCRNLSGIINPIEAKQRKGKGAVGAYGSERTTQSLQDFPAVDSEEEAEEVTRGRGPRAGDGGRPVLARAVPRGTA